MKVGEGDIPGLSDSGDQGEGVKDKPGAGHHDRQLLTPRRLGRRSGRGVRFRASEKRAFGEAFSFSTPEIEQEKGGAQEIKKEGDFEK